MGHHQYDPLLPALRYRGHRLCNAGGLLLVSGNYEASRRAAKNARTWTWVSVGVAAFCWLVYVLLVFVFAAAVSLPFLDL